MSNPARWIHFLPPLPRIHPKQTLFKSSSQSVVVYFLPEPGRNPVHSQGPLGEEKLPAVKFCTTNVKCGLENSDPK